MAIRDTLAKWESIVEYGIGTVIAKGLVKHIGKRAHIHCSVKYWSPSLITLGNDVEIRNGTFLDARSHTGKGITIGHGTRIKDTVAFAAYGGHICVGQNVLVGRCCTIFGHGGVEIGDYTMIGPNTSIISSNHLTYLDGTPFQSQGFTREPILIGENVWIGGHVCILAGTSIAPNVVIGAGAVVRGDIESGWLYSGIPAKPIKRLEDTRPEEVVAFTRDWNLHT